MRYAFVILLASHGLIHLMGFVKALYATDISKQVLGISKPMGSVWIIAFILFVISASQFLNHKKWFYLAFIAVFVSQVLIIMTWREAKYGTLINILIFLVAISALGNHRFNQMVDKEIDKIAIKATNPDLKVLSEHDIEQLPEIVKKWLKQSHVLGKEKIRAVKLYQKGKMRTKPNGKWMLFQATQYFNVENPSFVWTTTVNAMPIIKMIGRDKLIDGKGEMLIKLGGVIPIVNQSSNKKLNQGAMLRYLAEICWFPSAVLNDYITWEMIDATSAKATLTINGKAVSGLFSFSEEGELNSFEAKRYYGGEADSKLEKWHVEIRSYKLFNGIKIPNKSNVTWKLEGGDFNWLNVEILDIVYN